MRNLRNIREASLELGPQLNVLIGLNAQGKTSLLEALALLARGRSFRTEQIRSLIRRGSDALETTGTALGGPRELELAVEVGPGGRRLRVDGRDTAPLAYLGRLEAVVYSTDRLRVVRGPMRERRQFLDRAAGALWPAYRQCLREYERVVRQRNAALESGARGLEAWDERLVEVGGRLRHRRGMYVARLRQELQGAPGPAGERYDLDVPASTGEDLEPAREALAGELRLRRAAERRLRRTLAGPHRDEVRLLVDGEEAAESASSGQVRSLLLSLSLAMLEVYRRETGQAAVALLDDLDSELDESRSQLLVRALTARGQVVVTTAHPGWVQGLATEARVFQVEDGRVRAA